MHGNILTQRINYFEINAYKDYCRLIDHTPFLDTINDGPWELSGIEAITIDRMTIVTSKGIDWIQRKVKRIKNAKANSN